MTEPQGRTALYRLQDALGVLLYVGITTNPGRRFAEHARKSWWPEVACRTVEWFSTRTAAEAAETAAIKLKRPRYNVTHSEERQVLVTVAVPASLLPGLDLLRMETWPTAHEQGPARDDVLLFLLDREIAARGLYGEPPCWHCGMGWPEGVAVQSDICGCGQRVTPDGSHG